MNVMAKPKRKEPDESPRRPNRTGKPLQIYLPAEVRDALDRYIAAQKFEPTYTDVGELALQEFLQREGFWPPSDG